MALPSSTKLISQESVANGLWTQEARPQATLGVVPVLLVLSPFPPIHHPVTHATYIPLLSLFSPQDSCSGLTHLLPHPTQHSYSSLTWNNSPQLATLISTSETLHVPFPLSRTPFLLLTAHSKSPFRFQLHCCFFLEVRLP